MSDKQESDDEIKVISNKFISATTFSPVTNPQEQMEVTTSNSSHSESEKGCTIHDNIRNLPELNIPEKILFVVDTSKEENCTEFKLGTGAKYSSLFMIKRAVETFVNAKSTIQRKHEYGLMTLNSSNVHWICDFTSNIKTILNYLNTLEETREDEKKTFDMGQVFEEIKSRVPLSGLDSSHPLYTIRIILIYSRSNCIPRFHSGQKTFENLTENPYLFLDVLFVHEPPTTENLCEKVYAELTALDITSFSYILEVGRNAAKLHDNMAKLLAHPLQRPLQKDANYDIYTPTNLQEVHTNV